MGCSSAFHAPHPRGTCQDGAWDRDGDRDEDWDEDGDGDGDGLRWQRIMAAGGAEHPDSLISSAHFFACILGAKRTHSLQILKPLP